MSNEESQRLRELLERERAARIEAERACRDKDRFLASIGHELRTPLNAILGWARLLELGRLGTREVQRSGQSIARSARALARVADDLLDLSRISNGGIHIDAEETDLAEVVLAVIETAQPLAQAKGIRLQGHLPSGSCIVFGDPRRLQQAVGNLVNNALKFTSHGGDVDVTLTCAGAECEITVSDTGAGIPRDLLPSVFDRFRQPDRSVRHEFSGLGLGLPIVKEVVELHGGTVSADSPGEGRGATFTIRLPRLAPRERPAGASIWSDRATPGPGQVTGRAESGISLRGVRVLVVDDEPDTLEMLQHVLRDSRAEVAAAASANEAEALIAAFEPDVLVSDLSMPGRDGYDLIRSIRAKRGPQELPAAALTAFARPEDAVRAQAAGYQIHLPKPVEPEELVRIVAQLAGRLS